MKLMNPNTSLKPLSTSIGKAHASDLAKGLTAAHCTQTELKNTHRTIIHPELKLTFVLDGEVEGVTRRVVSVLQHVAYLHVVDFGWKTNTEDHEVSAKRLWTTVERKATLSQDFWVVAVGYNSSLSIFRCISSYTILQSKCLPCHCAIFYGRQSNSFPTRSLNYAPCV